MVSYPAADELHAVGALEQLNKRIQQSGAGSTGLP